MINRFRTYNRFRLFVAGSLAAALSLPLLVHTCVLAGSMLLFAGSDCCPEHVAETIRNDYQPCELHGEAAAPVPDSSAGAIECCITESSNAIDSTIVNVRTEVYRIAQIVIAYLNIHLLQPAVEYLREAVSQFNFIYSADKPARAHILNSSFLL